MFKKILIPVDIDNLPFADKAMKAAIIQAEQFGASLHVITVIPGFGMSLVGNFFPEDAMKKAHKAVEKQLKEFVANTVPQAISSSYEIVEGKPHKGILKVAKSIGADLIVMPSHNYRRTEKVLLGSCTSRVVEQSKVSVMVIKPDA